MYDNDQAGRAYAAMLLSKSPTARDYLARLVALTSDEADLLLPHLALAAAPAEVHAQTWQPTNGGWTAGRQYIVFSQSVTITPPPGVQPAISYVERLLEVAAESGSEDLPRLRALAYSFLPLVLVRTAWCWL